MNIQSSYIFLPNPYKKQEPSSHNENNVIVINIGKNVYSFLEKNFHSLSRVEADDDTPFRRQYRCSISDTDSDNEIHLVINEVADVTYLDVIVEGNSKRQMINCLETFQDIFLTSGIQEEYIDITNSIKEDALYLLDEPENSLSAALQLKLKSFLEDSARFYHCQFIISTHSPFLLSIHGAKIYDLDSDPVCVKSWTQLENVKTYYDFFKHHASEFSDLL